jgi:PD-(D/E)XK endonuclease
MQRRRAFFVPWNQLLGLLPSSFLVGTMQKQKKSTRGRKTVSAQRGTSREILSAPTIPHVKRRGEIGEAAFLAKASAMGFGVAKPWGDSDRYDFIVDVAGRLLKVQIKSAHCESAQPGGGYNLRCCGHRRHSYRTDEIDLLVAYIVPEDIWYIFPPSAFQTMTSLRLFPHHKQKTSRFERYREAWHAFYEVK